jgi:hypothetical protein
MRHQGKQTRAVAEDALTKAAGAVGGGGGGGSFTTLQVTLLAGLSPPTSANFTASSKFFFSLVNPNASTALGVPTIRTSTPGQPGLFQVQSDTPGTPGTVLAGDLSTYNVLITNP